MSDALAELERQLRAARKYRHLAGETLRRVGAWALARYPAPAEALKAAKRKLHQVFAAYCQPDHINRLGNEVEQLPPWGDREAHQAACRELLRQHSSTAERLELLESVYPALWQRTGRPRRVLDLACGYHPLALPWMGLDAAEYFACDIDERLVAAVNAYLARVGRPATACCKDLLVGVPDVDADVALLLKAVPCLEQQQKGATVALLQALPAPRVILSFPLESLGGRTKGMREHYGQLMTALATEVQAQVQTVEFPKEVFFIVTRQP